MAKLNEIIETIQDKSKQAITRGAVAAGIAGILSSSAYAANTNSQADIEQLTKTMASITQLNILLLGPKPEIDVKGRGPDYSGKAVFTGDISKFSVNVGQKMKNSGWKNQELTITKQLPKDYELHCKLNGEFMTKDTFNTGIDNKLECYSSPFEVVVGLGGDILAVDVNSGKEVIFPEYSRNDLVEFFPDSINGKAVLQFFALPREGYEISTGQSEDGSKTYISDDMTQDQFQHLTGTPIVGKDSHFGFEPDNRTRLVNGTGGSVYVSNPSGFIARAGEDYSTNLTQLVGATTDYDTISLDPAAKPGFVFEKCEYRDGTPITDLKDVNVDRFTKDIYCSFVPNPDQ